MPKFRMTAPTARFFPRRFGTLQPGDVVEAKENPDANWFAEETETHKVLAARQDTTSTGAKASKAKPVQTENPTPEEAKN